MSDLSREWFENSNENNTNTIGEEYCDSFKEEGKIKSLDTPSISTEWFEKESESSSFSISDEYLNISDSRSTDVKSDVSVQNIFPKKKVNKQGGQKKSQENDADRSYVLAQDLLKNKNLLFDKKSLYLYNGIIFVRLSPNEVERLIFKTYHKEIDVSNKLSVIKNTSHYLRHLAEEIDEFPMNPDIIVFPNGTLEVESGRFRNNSPSDKANFVVAFEYDPSRFDMPVIEKFLKRICSGDDVLYERHLQLFGYVLSNDMRGKSFIYLQGPSHTGKSKFCDLLSLLFPEDFIDTLDIQGFGDKFALGSLASKRLLIADDMSDTPIPPSAVSKIKQLTGSERIGGEEKYIPRFQFRPQSKMIFSSNAPLKLKVYDQAFVNRVVHFPFEHIIPQEEWDTDIVKKMKPEIPALFNHAFAAYKRLKDSNYIWAGADRFVPEIVIADSSVSIDKKQAIRWFVSNCCELVNDAIASVEDLQAAYNFFCNQNDYQPVVGDRFSREFISVMSFEYPGMIERIKIGNQQRGYRGIRLK